jgi:hypothetical protein
MCQRTGPRTLPSSKPPVSVRPRSRTHGPALLEAFPAIHRAALGWAEGNGGFLAALRAGGTSFRPVARIPRGIRARGILSPLGLASLASLGFVPETLLGKKHLLASGENELRPTFAALQNPIVELHLLLQTPRRPGKSMPGRRLPPRSPQWDKNNEEEGPTLPPGIGYCV